MKAIRAVVRGYVQGVGFRDFVETQARRLKLRGYARNLSDGQSVEVVAEGGEDALNELIEHLREGPRVARVNAVHVEWREPSGKFAEFGATW